MWLTGGASVPAAFTCGTARSSKMLRPDSLLLTLLLLEVEKEVGRTQVLDTLLLCKPCSTPCLPRPLLTAARFMLAPSCGMRHCMHSKEHLTHPCKDSRK